MSEEKQSLNIYKVSRRDQSGYGTYTSFIVCCKTEEEARKTYPRNIRAFYDNKLLLWYDHDINGNKKCIDDLFDSWIKGNQINSLEVKWLGVANNDIERSVLSYQYISC